MNSYIAKYKALSYKLLSYNTLPFAVMRVMNADFLILDGDAIQICSQSDLGGETPLRRLAFLLIVALDGLQLSFRGLR